MKTKYEYLYPIGTILRMKEYYPNLYFTLVDYDHSWTTVGYLLKRIDDETKIALYSAKEIKDDFEYDKTATILYGCKEFDSSSKAGQL